MPTQVNFAPNELAQLQAEGADALTATLRNAMSQAQGRAQAIIDRADRERRDLTGDERRQFDALSAQVDAAADKIEALGDDFNGRTNIPSRGRQVRAEIPETWRRGAGDVGGAAPTRISARSRDIFPGSRVDPYNGAFRSFGEFVRTVAMNGNDPRLQVQNAMDEGVGTAGGFLVPETYAFGILDQALQAEAIRPRATVLPMSTSVLNVPGFDFQDGTSGKRAGLVLTWGGESSTLTEQVGKTRAVVLNAKKGTILVRLSTELMEDAASFNVALTNAFSQAIQIGLDIAFLQGTGSGQPLGIVNAPATITITKEGSQAANTVLIQNLAKMLAQIAPSSFKNAVWFVHPTVLPLLYNLVVVIQNVAGTENVGGSFVGAVTQDPDGGLRIFGKPCVVTEGCSALSSAGDIVLADVSQYVVGLRRDFTVEMSNAPYFTTDEIGIRCRLRLDGQPIPASSTKLRDGSNVVSPFVILGAR